MLAATRYAMLCGLFLVQWSCSTAPRSPELEPGQVWTFSYDETLDSKATILAVEESEDSGTIFLVRVERQERATDPNGNEVILVSVFTKADLEQRVSEQVDRIDASDLMEAIPPLWKDLPRWGRSEEGSPLPRYLPREDPPPPIAEGDAIAVWVVCDEPGVRSGHELVGHRVHWEVDGVPCRDEASLRKALQGKGEERVPDSENAGEVRMRPVLLYAEPDIVYGDVADVLDVLLSVGFTDVRFGDGRKDR